MPNSAQILPNRIKLNLLYNQGVPEKLAVRILRWILTYGKFIFITVDILIIAAFAYRFKLDYDLSILNRRINTQLEFIESLSHDEILVSQLQERLKLTSKTYAKYPEYNNFFVTVARQIPQSVTLVTLNFSEESEKTKFKLTGQTKNNNDIAVFLKNLKQNFKNISLDNLNYDSGDFVFVITGETK